MLFRCISLCILLLCSPFAGASPITLPDGGVFDGELQDGLLHGKGEIVWPDGSRYEGAFQKGQHHGFGILTYSIGSKYEGEFVRGLYHGQGTYSQANGPAYVGQYELGDFKEGTVTEANGSEYKGHFKNFLLHGEGQVSVPGQGKWQGTFESGHLVGIGQYSGEDGQKYAGEFENWNFHGNGKLKEPDGAHYEGEFENGYFQGKGIYQNANERYEGLFEFGSYSGHGKLQYARGDLYEGSFERDRYSGEGKLTKPNGDILEGVFEWGELDGDGVIRFANGDHYKGQVRRGAFHGRGEFYQAAADILSKGYWDDGEQIFESDESMAFLGNSAERAIYQQQGLLEDALDSVARSNDDEIEMYFVGIGGYGPQAVFEREVRFVEDLLNQKYALEGRSVTLVNSASGADAYPLATVTSIERTLDSVAEKMNPKQDILFLYLTSHGSASHQLSLDQDGLDLPDLPAEYLAQIIRRLPFKYKIIAVSACYSGGFIEPLQDQNTLIMTAAREDRPSFGRSDDAEFTYFGRALFERSLAATFSFRNAFHQAFDLVSELEDAKNYKRSEPQIYAPGNILEYLEKWYLTLPNYRPDETSSVVLAKWWLREWSQPTRN